MTPYELRIQHDGFHRIGLVGMIDLREKDRVINILSGIDSESKRGTISNLHFFSRELGETTFIFAHCHFKGSNPDEAAAQVAQWVPAPWQRLELINLIALAPVPEEASISRYGLISRLNPEDEFTYRTLHQTTWTGVVDQLIRSNYRNWTTFLIQDQDQLFLFTYYEYVGSDKKADDAAIAADPTTKRWWKLAVPCLSSVEKGADLWSPMTRPSPIE